MKTDEVSEPGAGYVAGPILDGHLDGATTWSATEAEVAGCNTGARATCGTPGDASSSSSSSD